MNNPYISVVCPTYNSSKFIERTLLTVINQNRVPDELIVSDDGSSDETVSIIKKLIKDSRFKFPIILLENSHKGPGYARNVGIEKANGNWISFLDSDDLWTADKLSAVEKIIIKRKEVNFICHGENWENIEGNKKEVFYGKNYNIKKPLFNQLYWQNMFSTSAVTCKKKLLVSCGMFNEEMMSAQDYELWLRIATNMKPFFK